MKTEVTAVFDLGKTNKKFLLYDEALQPVYKSSVQLPGAVDEDLYPCEDYVLLKDWMLSTFAEAVHHAKYRIKGVNFSAYGATLVHLNRAGEPIAPIYNYLKPYDPALQHGLYERYGGRSAFSSQTASPPLGHLNSGLTLYWLQQQHPDVYRQIHNSLHLPEFCSFLFSEERYSGITSVGCHTHLWDFTRLEYHRWAAAEGLLEKLAPLAAARSAAQRVFNGVPVLVGRGLHDSSAALIPHLKREERPFLLLSTGTWCITLNPFSQEPLTDTELDADCLCYLSYEGAPVRAARYFAGKIHEDMVNGLCKEYGKSPAYFYDLPFDEGLGLIAEEAYDLHESISYYHQPNAAQAYHHFMYSLVRHLLPSIQLAKGRTPVRRLIVEGGFCRNKIFMTLLRRFCPQMEVLTSGDEEASALGAAMLTQELYQEHALVMA
ncbi:FGGY family carbohydrate kinase [Flaviaesturariibacter amylovorans]|uniref:FGGY-family carbohydrate kinase n=1 Tax=Flaviaesturariibacter amylovorans TaxID=1084520 RepID=A0ABP8H6Q3_9BACT